MEAELVRLWAGALRLSDLAAMPVEEVLDRLNAGRRAEAEARRFQLALATFPHVRDNQVRQEVVGSIRALEQSEVRRRGPLELLDQDRRVEQIGGMLRRHGQRWADAHPAEMRWLATLGVTPEQAMERHAAWYQKAVASDPFFVRARAEREQRRRRRVP